MEVFWFPAVSASSEKKSDVFGTGEEVINESDLSIFQGQLRYLLELVLDDLCEGVVQE